MRLVGADMERLLPGQITLPSMSCVIASAVAGLRNNKTAGITAATKLHRMGKRPELRSVPISLGTSTSSLSEKLRSFEISRAFTVLLAVMLSTWDAPALAELPVLL